MIVLAIESVTRDGIENAPLDQPKLQPIIRSACKSKILTRVLEVIKFSSLVKQEAIATATYRAER